MAEKAPLAEPAIEPSSSMVIPPGYEPQYPALPRDLNDNHPPDAPDSDDEGEKTCDHPSITSVVEWVWCLVFDAALMLAEAVFCVVLALNLSKRGLRLPYMLIFLFLVLPSVVNCLVWLKLHKNYKQRISAVLVFALLIFGVPSPLFLYVYHLYVTLFRSRLRAQDSRNLANTFRLVHACLFSAPMLLLNLITLIGVLKVDDLEDEQGFALHLSQLSAHLGEVTTHGPAFLLCALNLVRAAALYNERQTFPLLFWMVALPMIKITVIFRILCLGVVFSFLEPEKSALLVIALAACNMILYCLTHKRARRAKTKDAPSPEQPGGRCGWLRAKWRGCCGDRSTPLLAKLAAVSGTESRNWFTAVARLVCLSVCSVVCPSGYTNDAREHHPRIKGGLFLVLNYVMNSLLIGLALGFTIYTCVPNTIHGITMPKMAAQIRVPASKLKVAMAGLDISLDVPQTDIDLADMHAPPVTLRTGDADRAHAVIVPLLLAMLVLPFIVMRAAMMELDCFVVRRKDFGEHIEEVISGDRKIELGATSSEVMTPLLLSTIHRNVRSKELKARLYTTLCCSGFALVTFSVSVGVTVLMLVTTIH